MSDKQYGEGKFEAVIVKNMADTGAFDEACKGVSSVVHFVSILTFDTDPNKVISDVVSGARQKPNVEFTISTKNWNNEDIEAAWKPAPYEPERAWSVYGASKTQAEQKMWDFVKEKKPSFVLNAVLPNSNMGEIISDKQPASTGGWVRSLYNGDVSPLKN
ncbi:hypothetical protein OEA41_009676 [Lepraria neglecta]|uniref:Uncharacterized protein n=1 Tax=Lepraria neglecta TaxID=209136 RepID=A0AAE0DI01_9LECA|nr:hypothetical protein OEA41_009676 [Lepraria neglecta]